MHRLKPDSIEQVTIFRDIDIVVEEWRPIVGFPNCSVSSLGRVHSPYKILKASVDGNGYLTVKLTHEDGSRKTIAVHREVARAFLGPRPINKEVRHLNGDPSNPALANLLYGTRSENRFDAYRHGRLGGIKDKNTGQKTKNTKDKKYGENRWPALMRAGIKYSKVYDL